MAEFDYREFYIGYPGHPRFTINKIIVDDLLRVIVQKYEMILFTNQGELLGDPDFGCDLERLLWQTKISANAVKNRIISQIDRYIPELVGVNYQLEVEFFENPENFQDAMSVNFTIADFEINAIVI